MSKNKKSEETLQHEERFRYLVNNSSDWFWEFDENETFTYSSPRLKTILGYEPEEFIGMNAFDVIPSPNKEIVYKEFSEIKKNREPFTNLENINIHKDGSLVVLESSAVPIFDSDGNFRGYRGIDRDITERQRNEEKNRQSNKMEAIGTLASGIAHDFNNILTGILGYSELINETSQEEETTSSAKEIIKASIRARDLVAHILTYTRDKPADLRYVDVIPLLDGIFSLVKATTPTSINIIKDIRCSKCIVNSDPTQIHQVIMNICTNSIFAMKNSSGKLEIILDLVDLSKEKLNIFPDVKHGIFAKLTIKDTGIGINPAIMEKVYDPYFTTKKVGEGSGLGLSIVQGIIKNHNGLIDISSIEGEGTTVTILLPEHHNEVIENDLDEPCNQIKKVTKKNILLVDDEIAITKVFKAHLENNGHKVTHFNKSSEALDYFISNSESIDLVITDQTMPNLIGTELVKKIREISNNENLKVILCTGYSEIVSELDLEKYCIDSFLNKPVTRNTLLETVNNLFK